jgi:hypothetical protein
MPVVGRVVGVGALVRAPRRDAEPAAPVEMDAQQVDAELLERRVEVRGIVVVRAAAVGDAATEPGRGSGRRDARESDQSRDGEAGRELSPHVSSIGRRRKQPKCSL